MKNLAKLTALMLAAFASGLIQAAQTPSAYTAQCDQAHVEIARKGVPMAQAKRLDVSAVQVRGMLPTPSLSGVPLAQAKQLVRPAAAQPASTEILLSGVPLNRAKYGGSAPPHCT
ncbi:MAG: hypothetical protein EKK53_06225 [Burkholderiales bacterium]|nr:MAG: hypothetical protein EKK53_06225 [Burkholderiales bacterium]